MCERAADQLIFWLPMYSEAKVALVVYLWHPRTQGAVFVYDTFLQPFLQVCWTGVSEQWSRSSGASGERTECAPSAECVVMCPHARVVVIVLQARHTREAIWRKATQRTGHLASSLLCSRSPVWQSVRDSAALLGGPWASGRCPHAQPGCPVPQQRHQPGPRLLH